MEITKISGALRQAIIEEMDKDESVVLIGEDIGIFDGAYRVTEGLLEKYGERRVCDTPISEAAIIGACVGAAMTGLRPIAEIQFNDFLTCCMDQICNQAAKIRLMMGGQVQVPMVIRAPIGCTGRAAQHSQSLEAWFMHTPGIKVIMPSTPYDAKGLMTAAIRDNNPVMIFEHKMLYGATSPGGKLSSTEAEMGVFTPAPMGEYTIPFGKADIKKKGDDITVVATGYMVHKSIIAANTLEEEGISVEVIDPRTLVPLDIDTIIESVEKTGRLVIVSEDTLTCGFASEVAALVSEKAIYSLDYPIKRVCTKDTPIPFAPDNEKVVIPQVSDILTAIKELF